MDIAKVSGIAKIATLMISIGIAIWKDWDSIVEFLAKFFGVQNNLLTEKESTVTREMLSALEKETKEKMEQEKKTKNK